MSALCLQRSALLEKKCFSGKVIFTGQCVINQAQSEWASASTRWHFAFALCCHSVVCDSDATVRAVTRARTVRTTSTTVRRTSVRTAPRARTASTATGACARAATPDDSARSRRSRAPSSTTSAASANTTTARTVDCASNRPAHRSTSANVRRVACRSSSSSSSWNISSAPITNEM